MSAPRRTPAQWKRYSELLERARLRPKRFGFCRCGKHTREQVEQHTRTVDRILEAKRSDRGAAAHKRKT